MWFIAIYFFLPPGSLFLPGLSEKQVLPVSRTDQQLLPQLLIQGFGQLAIVKPEVDPGIIYD